VLDIVASSPGHMATATDGKVCVRAGGVRGEYKDGLGYVGCGQGKHDAGGVELGAGGPVRCYA
jgi:hypothetical protein